MSLPALWLCTPCLLTPSPSTLPRSLSSIRTLRDVEPLAHAAHGSGDKAVEAVLHEGLYSIEEIEGALGLSLDK